MGDLVVSYFMSITMSRAREGADGNYRIAEWNGVVAGAGIGEHYALCVGRGSLHNLRFGRLVAAFMALWLSGSAERKYSFTSPAL